MSTFPNHVAYFNVVFPRAQLRHTALYFSMGAVLLLRVGGGMVGRYFCWVAQLGIFLG